MKWCLIILFFLLILFQSCKNDDSSTPNLYAAKTLSQLNSTDTFLFDLPPLSDYWDSVCLTHLPLHEKWLNLKSIQKGCDSIEIRIWYVCWAGCGRRLVRLFHDRQKWQAEISNVISYGGGKEGSSYFDSMSRDIKYKNPKSGWMSFVDHLFDLKILTLPDDSEIPNFEEGGATDGDWVEIEVSTKNAYRYYNYGDPYFPPRDYWQTKNLIKIFKIISTEFDISEWPEAKKIDDKKQKREVKNLILLPIKELNLDSIEKAKKKMKK